MDYPSFVYTIEAHLAKYIKTHYVNHKKHPHHPYILDPDYPVEESLLMTNREAYRNLIKDTIEIHSRGNFKSSQLMSLDLFLPFLNHLDKLSKRIGIDHIQSIEFEKVFSDYTHVDVFMLTQSQVKIICELKYTEKEFQSHTHKNELRSAKFRDIYHRINDFMMGEPVTERQFLKNYQLYRNLYNAMNHEHGLPGYLLLIYPKDHPLLDDQFNRFYKELKDIHQFKHCDRIRCLYLEILGTNKAFRRKYLAYKK